MKRLLQEYRETLNETVKKVNYLESPAFKSARKKKGLTATKIDEDCTILRAAESNLHFVIEWLERGFQPDAHWRGIEKNDAYYVLRSYDPSMMEVLIENKQANEPYEMIDESLVSIEEKEERERITFEDSLTRGMAGLFEKAKEMLTREEQDILLLLQQEMPQSEIANLIGVSQQAISKRIKRIKKKLSELGIERADL
ncbi:sigma factor-like helix-turn-helix DNA-binding protein [Lysinibacillus sp. UGB7]|uniref:sigma factor-like helix-turn-helix DNA-binding protein n=1 Tax=Lysinibacillus sp. UGB7 TaxID=3411039 RepID=UPI003B7B9329